MRESRKHPLPSTDRAGHAGREGTWLGRLGVVRLSEAAAEGRWTALSSSCGGCFRPQVGSVAAEVAEGGSGDQVTLVIVGVGDGCVSGEEALG